LGELLDKEEMLTEILGERNTYRYLSSLLQEQRDEYKDQREALRELFDLSTAIREEYRKQREDMEKDLALAEEELKDSWSPLQVGLLCGGVAVVSVVAGVGIYALATAF